MMASWRPRPRRRHRGWIRPPASCASGSWCRPRRRWRSRRGRAGQGVHARPLRGPTGERPVRFAARRSATAGPPAGALALGGQRGASRLPKHSAGRRRRAAHQALSTTLIPARISPLSARWCATRRHQPRARALLGRPVGRGAHDGAGESHRAQPLRDHEWRPACAGPIAPSRLPRRFLGGDPSLPWPRASATACASACCSSSASSPPLESIGDWRKPPSATSRGPHQRVRRGVLPRLMIAYQQLNRRGDAPRYQRCRRPISRLGLVPSAETEAVRKSIQARC